MTVLASDTFNRANESPIASPWVNISGSRRLQLSSNAVRDLDGTAEDLAYYDGSISWPNDQYSKVTAFGTITDSDLGPAIRCSTTSGGNGYFVSIGGGGNVFLDKIVNGSHSGVTFVSGTLGTTAELRMSGTTITYYKNGVSGLSTTDASLSSGAPGLYVYGGSGNFIDSWEGGDLATTSTRTVTPSGGISFSGTGARSYARAKAAAGGLSFAGTGARANVRAKAASGGLTFAGTGSFAKGATRTPAGGLSLVGTAALLRVRTKAGAGGLQFAGAATYSSVGGHSFTYAAVGGLTFGGAAAKTSVRVSAPAGGLTFAGAASFAKGATRAAAGGLTLGGTAAQLRARTTAAAGGLQFGGAASASFVGAQSFSYSATGGLSFSGAATKARVTVRAASGGVAFSGAATLSSHESTRVVVPAGGLQFGGTSASSSFDSSGATGLSFHLLHRRRRR